MAEQLKLLQFIQKVYQHLGFRPSQSDSIHHAINWRNIFMLSSFVQLLIFSIAFLIFEAKSIVDIGTSLYVASTEISCIAYYLIHMRKIPNILKLIENFEQFIAKRIRKSAVAAEKYSELSENIEKLSQLFIKIVKWNLIGNFSSAVITTLSNYFVLDLKEESYYLPFPIMLPFNWRTPFGYVIALYVTYSAMLASLFSSTPIICFVIASCRLLMAFIKDLRNDSYGLNVNKRREINGQKLKKRLNSIVRQYCMIEQCIASFNNIYEFIIFGYFAWSLTSLCTALFLVVTLLSQPEPNPFEITTPVAMVMSSILSLAFYCEYGEAVLNQFNEFDDELYQHKWYLFPLDMKRMLVIVLANTQRPPCIRGFASTVCTREAFKKTTQAGFSYFMTMRQLDG